MDETLDRLLHGFAEFRDLYLGEQRDLFVDLVENGQRPKVLVIGCSDSRVDPALLTRARPGDLFVVRNVAAIVPPFETGNGYHGTSSAIEFAVRGLEVDHIIVLGHEMCGGVRTLAAPAGRFDFLDNWVAIMDGVRQRVDGLGLSPAARQRALEMGCVLQSIQNLLTFPWIADRVRGGRLSLHGWYFDLREGQLLAYDPAAQHFHPAPAAARPAEPLASDRGPACACGAMPSLALSRAPLAPTADAAD